jgi:DNA-binding response OmpR family regulator
MKKKILVVDDDDGILDAFQAMLESVGYTVAVCSDGECVNQFVEDDPPDLILLDVLLSGRDGREVCQELKKNEQTKAIPVIMVSAHPRVKQSTLDAGADDFLEKPFEMEELLAVVRRNLEN